MVSSSRDTQSSSPSSHQQSLEDAEKGENKGKVVNKPKVGYGMLWYVGSLVGYALMEKFDQGLRIRTSKEMLMFTASETLFMVSMALSYFYSW